MTQTSITSSLLRKSDPKLAFSFDDKTRKYDYEASGNDAVLVSPSNATKLLQGDEARDFWVALDALEEQHLDSQESYDRELELLVKSFFDRELASVTAGLFDFDRRNTERRKEPRPTAERRQSVADNARSWAQSVKKVDRDRANEFAEFYSKQSPHGDALLAEVWPQYQAKYGSKFAIQVDATSVKKASVTFISGAEWQKGKVSKLKFTTNRSKARMFPVRIAQKIQAQLPEFKLTGALVKG
jgi:hypothetical protein